MSLVHPTKPNESLGVKGWFGLFGSCRIPQSVETTNFRQAISISRCTFQAITVTARLAHVFGRQGPAKLCEELGLQAVAEIS